MVKLHDNIGIQRSSSPTPDDPPVDMYDTPQHSRQMGSFVLDKNGQLNIDRRGVDMHYGFRLQELNHNSDICSNKDLTEDTTSVSAYSNYKHRIDSMFDDTRSQVSEQSQPRRGQHHPEVKYSSVHKGEVEKSAHNIQDKIEKMFEEISIHGFTKSNSFTNYRAQEYNKVQRKEVPEAQKTMNHIFQVDYLGSLSMPDKLVSLLGLQDPLTSLYMDYKRKNGDHCRLGVNTLEISKEGLKINTSIKDQGALNPFPTIAVWAAVKFVCRKNERKQNEFAFLPLIADPDGIDKNTLFRALRVEEERMIIRTCKKDIDNNDDDNHAPLFAVVIRKSGTPKMLECHGFVCSSSEDAIVIAANLYKALMKNMGKKKRNKQEEPKNNEKQNVVQSYGNFQETPVDSLEIKLDANGKKIPPPVPTRPGKKGKLTSLSSMSSEGEELILELEQVFKEVRKQTVLEKSINSFCETEVEDVKERPKTPEKVVDVKQENIYETKYDKKIENKFEERKYENKTENKETKLEKKKENEVKEEFKLKRRGSEPCVYPQPSSVVRRSVSERRNNGTTTKDTLDMGDILTKVAIPRSRSFLNANGPLTRYSRRTKSTPTKSDGETGSPLGFNELFNEFRIHEGLESMDDILNAIIDSEGMSFNDLKPIYKEFLLKLAVTLTKDELYQRSKNIMRRQRKKKKHQRYSSLSRKTIIAATGLRKVFKKTTSRFKTKAPRPTSFEFTSVVYQSSAKHFEVSSTTSTSSCDTKKKPTNRLNRRQSRRKSSKYQKSKTDRQSSTTNKKFSSSDDSDFFTQTRIVKNVRRAGNESSGGHPNRSSSGYFSCSECSYDSESCTCTSADKCYCTLGQRRKKATQPNVEVEKKEDKVHRTSPVTMKTNSENNKSTGSLQVSGLEVVYDKESLSSCGCDTDSCVDSEKCYCSSQLKGEVKHLSDVKGVCQTPHLHQQPELQHNKGCPNFRKGNEGCKKHGQTIFDQLKEQGFAASESSLSRAASPSTAWKNNERIISKKENGKEGLKPSRSLEFLQVRPPHRSESRQQLHECPPPPPQEDMTRSGVRSSRRGPMMPPPEFRRSSSTRRSVDGTRHQCYHGIPNSSVLYRREYSYPIDRTTGFNTKPGFNRRGGMFHSMRLRNDYYAEFMQNTRQHKIFGSMRSKSSTDNIMDRVLFPNTNGVRNSLRFPKRIDVYNSYTRLPRSCSNPSVFDCVDHGGYMDVVQQEEVLPEPVMVQQPCRHDSVRVQHLHEKLPPRRHKESDNFRKLDYELFTASSKSDATDSIPNRSNAERKVLVVSARDPKGKVLYMGASSRGEKHKKRTMASMNKNYMDPNSSDACEALSVKKSAEIAALFSDVSRVKTHRSSCKEDVHYAKERSKRPRSYNTCNMENSLGYLP